MFLKILSIAEFQNDSQEVCINVKQLFQHLTWLQCTCQTRKHVYGYLFPVYSVHPIHSKKSIYSRSDSRTHSRSQFFTLKTYRALEFWNLGNMEPRKHGTLEFQNLGILEFWNLGILEFWNSGTLEFWNLGILESWKH